MASCACAQIRSHVSEQRQQIKSEFGRQCRMGALLCPSNCCELCCWVSVNGWLEVGLISRLGFMNIPIKHNQAGVATGAGELSMPVIMVVSPGSPPWLSLSLGSALLPGGFTSLELSLFVSPLASRPLARVGAFQDDIPQTAPVKDLS